MSEDEKRIRFLEDELSRLTLQFEHIAFVQQERDLLEREHRLSQKRFLTVFEESVIGKKIIDEELNITKVNEAFLQILDYPENEILGRKITDFSHPDYLVQWKKLQEELWTTDLPSFSFDTCLIKKNGDITWVAITSILIEDEGKMLGYTIARDISERKELERLKALIQEQEHRQQIAETILNTQEEERRRVSESLHNGLGQVLFAVKLSLGNIKIKHDANHPESENALKYTEELLANCMQECRRISHDLTPVALEQHGLKTAMEDICIQLTDQVTFKSSVRGFSQRTDRFLEVAIYRIVQELMMNIVKHAEATQASVTITEKEADIQIRVKDNGKGFDEKEIKRKSIGLQTVRYRVSLLTGTVNVSSAKDKGTSVNISIPKRIA